MAESASANLPADVPAATPAAARAAPRLARPRRHEAATAWLVMLLCLLAAAPAVLIELYRPEVTDPDEAMALATSIHTWKRINSSQSVGETFIQQLVPHYNGKSDWHRAPGVTWTHLLTFDVLSTTPIKKLSETATIADTGHVAPPAPLESLPAAGLTRDELAEQLTSRAEKRGDWRDVTITVRPAPQPQGVKTPVSGGEEPGKLAAGDKLVIDVSYAEANWRSNIDTIRLIKWGRLASAGLGLLFLASVFWAAYAIAGLRAAALSALVCAANPLFLWYARLASPPMHQAAWTMLSIAAALWAIRPMRATPSVERQFMGWVISGLAFGAAGLSIGPLVVVVVGGPIVLMLLLCPHRRGHLMGLLAAVLIGVLVTVPWTALLHDHDPDAAARWWREHQPFGRGTLEVFWNNLGPRLGNLLLLLLPWTLWMIGAVAQPFSTSSRGVRIRLFLGLSWFALTLAVLLCLPQMEEIGGLLLLTPAWAVSIGLLIHHYAEMADEGRFARLWRWLRWPHLLLMAVASIVVPLLISWPQWFVNLGVIDKELFFDPGWWYSIVLMISLAALAVWAIRQAIQEYPTSMAVITACWALLLGTALMVPATRGPWAFTDVRADADKLVKLSDNCPIFVMRGERFSAVTVEPIIALYTGREIRPIQPGEIEQVAQKQKSDLFLLSRLEAPLPAPNVQHVRDLRHVGLTVWRYSAAQGTAARH